MNRENAVLCGGLIVNGALTDIFCDASIGEMFYDEELGSSMMIGELSVTDPIELPDTRALQTFLRESELKGAIYTKSGIYAILSDTVAELRPLGKASEATGKTIMIDLDVEAEFED